MRIWRDEDGGRTYIERGAGGGVMIVPDHGGPGDVAYRFRPVDGTDCATLVYDDQAMAAFVERRPADVEDRVSIIVDRLVQTITAAKIPGTVKAELRAALHEATGTDA